MAKKIESPDLVGEYLLTKLSARKWEGGKASRIYLDFETVLGLLGASWKTGPMVRDWGLFYDVGSREFVFDGSKNVAWNERLRAALDGIKEKAGLRPVTANCLAEDVDALLDLFLAEPEPEPIPEPVVEPIPEPVVEPIPVVAATIPAPISDPKKSKGKVGRPKSVDHGFYLRLTEAEWVALQAMARGSRRSLSRIVGPMILGPMILGVGG